MDHKWSQTHSGLQGLSWELYNRTAGNESTPMKNDQIRFKLSDRFHRQPTQLGSHCHDAHTQKCIMFADGVYTSTTFSYSVHATYSLQLITMVTNISWFAGSLPLGTIQQDQQGMKVTPMKNDKIRFNFVDRFHRHYPHNIIKHSMTLMDTRERALFGDGVYTSTTFSYSAQENYSLQNWSQMTDWNISWFVRVWMVMGTIQQDSREWKYATHDDDPQNRWRMVNFSDHDNPSDTPTQVHHKFHDAHTQLSTHCSGMASTTINNVL